MSSFRNLFDKSGTVYVEKARNVWPDVDNLIKPLIYIYINKYPIAGDVPTKNFYRYIVLAIVGMRYFQLKKTNIGMKLKEELCKIIDVEIAAAHKDAPEMLDRFYASFAKHYDDCLKMGYTPESAEHFVVSHWAFKGLFDRLPEDDIEYQFCDYIGNSIVAYSRSYWH